MKKSVCITGATDGLGKALALELSQKSNYELILCGRNAEKMKILLDELPEGSVIYHSCFDLLNDSEINQFTQDLKQRGIIPDILINNAGANVKKASVTELDLDDLRTMLQLNCLSHVALIQAFYAGMKNKGSGHIINVLSSTCLYSNETMAGYTASKSAMQAISKILLKEARPDHIKVTSVYPGGIDTNFRVTPNHSYMKPQTVAKAIVDCIELPEDAVMHDIILRPFSETNF